MVQIYLSTVDFLFNYPTEFWNGAGCSGRIIKKKTKYLWISMHQKMGAFSSILWRLLVPLCTVSSRTSKCRWHSRVNYYVMDIAVSYSPYGLLPLCISWGRICCIYYHYFGWSLPIFYRSGLPHLLGTPSNCWPCRLIQQWVGVHNLIPSPPCEVLPGLLFFPRNFIIIPNYNGIERFW